MTDKKTNPITPTSDEPTADQAPEPTPSDTDMGTDTKTTTTLSDPSPATPASAETHDQNTDQDVAMDEPRPVAPADSAQPTRTPGAEAKTEADAITTARTDATTKQDTPDETTEDSDTAAKTEPAAKDVQASTTNAKVADVDAEPGETDAKATTDITQPSAPIVVPKPKPKPKRVVTEPIVRHDVSLLTDDDVDSFNHGKHYRIYNVLGAHVMELDDVDGTYFAVWAPNAERVSVIGDFNGWNRTKHPLQRREGSGIWHGFIEGIGSGTVYKYYIESQFAGYKTERADPIANYAEIPPNSASVVWDMSYTWNDDEWMSERAKTAQLDAPISIYEMHLGSWMRPQDGDRQFFTYREVAPKLAEYVKDLGFTHVELMPIMEHPFYGSWGYQLTGYFAPSSRYGTPQDFMYLVDYLHQQGIGVILDWVPSHFATDGHGLSYFDGTHLYEHAYRQKGWHPDWQSYIFNYGRYEVISFLISSALTWLDRYHIDGLRVDAVASMLYLDYSRKEGEWMANKYGGRENLEAIDFLRRFNEEVYTSFPDVQTIAEESTSWGMVSRPTYVGGLGFGMKWDMGWMHDTLLYMAKDAIHRKYHHSQLTFRMMYAYSENFVLSLSHDEVVHGKGALLNKMSGDDWQKFANLRLLYSYMYSMPSKKLLFMGCELGQWKEWNHEESLHWHLLNYEPHVGIHRLVKDLNHLYRNEPALYELECEPGGFNWVDCNDWEQSVITFTRTGKTTKDIILVACNFTPVPRKEYKIGVPQQGYWKEMFNSDARWYWGSNMGNGGGVVTYEEEHYGYPYTLYAELPPLGAVFFKWESPLEDDEVVPEISEETPVQESL